MKKKNLHGLSPKHFSEPFRWKVDQDYIKKLSLEEAQWLAKFNREYVGGDFRGKNPLHGRKIDRRTIWREKQVTRRDVMSRRLANEAVVESSVPAERIIAAIELKRYLKRKTVREKVRRILKKENR